MAGYKIRLILYSSVETWRELIIPEDITFKQLHNIIQKVFNFLDYHNWCFQVPESIPDEDAVDLNKVIQEITSENADNVKIADIVENHPILLYLYDFGDGWEIVVNFDEKVDYDNETATITDYAGKYSPMDDMGGIMVFEEIMECVDNPDELKSIMADYGLSRRDLTQMNFEKKFKKGSKIIIGK